MILFINGQDKSITFEIWFKIIMNDNERKILFPEPGEYDIYIIDREYIINPMAAKVDKKSALKYINYGSLIKYTVE